VDHPRAAAGRAAAAAVFLRDDLLVDPVQSLVDQHDAQQLSALREKNPNARLEQVWVPYERISNNLKRAVIASEDANFTEHDGIDWEALEKAYERNNKRHKVVGGGSTITQQLAKNLFLSGSRNYLRKGQELVIAYMLETVMSKQRILEIYLNVVEFGRGVFGAEAAARHYYRSTAARLTQPRPRAWR
jgi:monofunctional biosynthetic peptidoglycan transglycosylase